MSVWVSIVGKGTVFRGYRAGSMAVYLRGRGKADVSGAERQRMSETGGQRFKGLNQVL